MIHWSDFSLYDGVIYTTGLMGMPTVH